MRRFIAVFMVVIMGISVNSNVYASTSNYENKAILLKELGLFQGNENGFELERAPSRVEGAVMLIRLMGKENEVIEGVYDHPFTDVPFWADHYIGYMYENGLTNGIGNNQFGSNDLIEGKSYATFVLRSLGYDDSIGEFNWATALQTCVDKGILDADENTRLAQDTFLRDDMVNISYNALRVQLNKASKTLIEKLVSEGAVEETVAMNQNLISGGDSGTTDDGTSNATAVARGNSLGNIANGGYVAKKGDNIYFSNMIELCVKNIADNTVSTIAEGEITFIHVLDGWVYYCDYDEPGLYKIRENGTDKVKITDVDESYKCVDIYDGWIYYVSDGTLYKISVEGEEQQTLSVGNGWPDIIKVYVIDDAIYYSGDKGIYKMKTDGTGMEQLLDEEIYKMQVEGNWIYYVNDSDGGIERMDLDGNNKTSIVEAGIEHREDVLLIEGGWIYYTEYFDEEYYEGQYYGRLYRIKADGTNKELIVDDICVTFNDETAFDNYFAIIEGTIYYASNEGGSIYTIDIDGSNKTDFYTFEID